MGDSRSTDSDPEMCLLNAVKAKDIPRARQLLEAGTDPDTRTIPMEAEVSPLANAVFGGSQELVELLFEHGARGRMGEFNDDELHYAAARPNLDILCVVFDRWQQFGYDVGRPNASGHTALHYAAEEARLENCRFLLQRGASVGAATVGWDPTPLHLAAGNLEAVEIVKLLMAAGTDINAVARIHDPAIWNAVQVNNVEVISLLLESDLQYRNYYKETILHQAAHSCDLETVQMLVRAGADVNAVSKTNTTLLHRAAEGGHTDTVEWLLNGHNLMIDAVNTHGWTALMFACCSNHLDTARFLLDHGADINATTHPDSLSPLHFAAAYKHRYPEDDSAANTPQQDGEESALVNHLIDSGAKISHFAHLFQRMPDDHGERMLNSNYCDYEEFDPYIGYPLFAAALSNSLAKVKALLHHGADINAKESRDRTVLHYLRASQGYEDMVKFLIHKGADYRAVDDEGWTIAHLAAFELRNTAWARAYLQRVGIYEPSMEGDIDLAVVWNMRSATLKKYKTV